jgi:hypothetical protein
MRHLLGVLSRWFTERSFRSAGDRGYGTHTLVRFASRQPRLTLVNKFCKDANFSDPPPAAEAPHQRPAVNGRKRRSPQDVVAKTRRRRRLQVSWYRGDRRQVPVVMGTGHWYKWDTGAGSCPL